MTFYTGSLLLSALLCTLTAGLLFTFAVVVMPGIRSLPDREFLASFAAMDRIIQQNEPRFILVWVGSVLVLVAAAYAGFASLDGASRFIPVGAAALYILGVQLPTVTVNVPLNNRLQALDLDGLSQDALEAERAAFETRWNAWNGFRTVVACVTAAVLLALVTAL